MRGSTTSDADAMTTPINFLPRHPPASAPILIVENDADIRDIAETALSEAGYRVITAADGMAAFLAFERHCDIALMFTDIVMPRIDGLMLADMARRRRPDVKILYATGYGAETSRQPGYRHGELLAKPYRPGELVAAVAAALDAPSRSFLPHA